MSEHGSRADVAGEPSGFRRSALLRCVDEAVAHSRQPGSPDLLPNFQRVWTEQIILLLMSTVKDIETAVRSLSAAELVAFRNWFLEFDVAAWDRRIEADVHAGRLDALAAEALADVDANRCTDR
jgi:hypothetical protein